MQYLSDKLIKPVIWNVIYYTRFIKPEETFRLVCFDESHLKFVDDEFFTYYSFIKKLLMSKISINSKKYIISKLLNDSKVLTEEMIIYLIKSKVITRISKKIPRNSITNFVIMECCYILPSIVKFYKIESHSYDELIRLLPYSFPILYERFPKFDIHDIHDIHDITILCNSALKYMKFLMKKIKYSNNLHAVNDLIFLMEKIPQKYWMLNIYNKIIHFRVDIAVLFISTFGINPCIMRYEIIEKLYSDYPEFFDKFISFDNMEISSIGKFVSKHCKSIGDSISDNICIITDRDFIMKTTTNFWKSNLVFEILTKKFEFTLLYMFPIQFIKNNIKILEKLITLSEIDTLVENMMYTIHKINTCNEIIFIWKNHSIKFSFLEIMNELKFMESSFVEILIMKHPHLIRDIECLATDFIWSHLDKNTINYYRKLYHKEIFIELVRWMICCNIETVKFLRTEKFIQMAVEIQWISALRRINYDFISESCIEVIFGTKYIFKIFKPVIRKRGIELKNVIDDKNVGYIECDNKIINKHIYYLIKYNGMNLENIDNFTAEMVKLAAHENGDSFQFARDFRSDKNLVVDIIMSGNFQCRKILNHVKFNVTSEFMNLINDISLKKMMNVNNWNFKNCHTNIKFIW